MTFLTPIRAIPAKPVSFMGCSGLLHPGAGRTGVLVCAPWGYEELCLRKSLRQWCDLLASQGTACLRFDYPGSGSSVGDWDSARMEDWIDAARAGADVLHSIGVREIVLAGFGIGGLVALSLCQAGFQAKGLSLVAAPETGARHLRKMALWNAMILQEAHLEKKNEKIDDSSPESRAAARIAGFLAPPALAEAIAAFDLKTFDKPPAQEAIIALRGEAEDESLVKRLEVLGVKVRSIPFPGYPGLVNSPTAQVIPAQSFSHLAQAMEPWLDKNPAAAERREDAKKSEFLGVQGQARLEGKGWREKALRFGFSNRLYGIICAPSDVLQEDGRALEVPGEKFSQQTPGVVLISSGRNPLNGWRRSQTDLARDLAQSGIVTLRFDLSDIGDSMPAPDQPEEILYSDWPIADMRAALSMLQNETSGPIGLYGACSGAFLALRTALADPRVRFLIQLNPIRLEWHPLQTTASALLYGNRSIITALSRFSFDRLKTIISDRRDAKQRLQRLAAQGWDRLRVALMFSPWPLNIRRAMYKRVQHNLDVLRNRAVPHVIAYTAGDDGLYDFADYFGEPNGSLPQFSNVTTAVLEDADHNLTFHAGADWIAGLIREAARQALGVEASKSASQMQNAVNGAIKPRRLTQETDKADCVATPVPQTAILRQRGRVRLLRPDDIKSLAGIFLKVFRISKDPLQAQKKPERLMADLHTLFIDHPRLQPERGSLVYERADGSVGGFIGVLPIEFFFDGLLKEGAAISTWMVEDRIRDAEAGALLARSHLKRQYAITMGDTANHTALEVQLRLRMHFSAAHSMKWAKILSYGALAAGAAAERTPLGSSFKWVGKVAAAENFLRSSFSKSEIAGSQSALVIPISVEEFAAGYLDLISGRRLRPNWSLDDLMWRVGVANRRPSLGPLRFCAVESGTRQRIAYAAYHISEQGRATVLAITVRPREEEATLRALFADAQAKGCSLMRGICDPALAIGLFGVPGVFYRNACGVTIKAHNLEIVRAALVGEGVLGGLVGDAWTPLASETYM